MKLDLEWVILVTDHFSDSFNFYKNILGLPLKREAPKEHFAQFQLDNNYLAIYGRKEMEQLTSQKLGQAGGAIYAFGEVDDVDQTFKRLKRQGVNFIKPPQTQPWGQRTAYFTDPDGHIWEIQKWIA